MGEVHPCRMWQFPIPGPSPCCELPLLPPSWYPCCSPSSLAASELKTRLHIGLQADASKLRVRYQGALKQNLLWALHSSAARKSPLLGLLGSWCGQSSLCKQPDFLWVMSNARFPCVRHNGLRLRIFPLLQGKKWRLLGTQRAGLKLQLCVSVVCPAVLSLTVFLRWKHSSYLYLVLPRCAKPSPAWPAEKAPHLSSSSLPDETGRCTQA